MRCPAEVLNVWYIPGEEEMLQLYATFPAVLLNRSLLFCLQVST